MGFISEEWNLQLLIWTERADLIFSHYVILFLTERWKWLEITKKKRYETKGRKLLSGVRNWLSTINWHIKQARRLLEEIIIISSRFQYLFYN